MEQERRKKYSSGDQTMVEIGTGEKKIKIEALGKTYIQGWFK